MAEKTTEGQNEDIEQNMTKVGCNPYYWLMSCLLVFLFPDVEVVILQRIFNFFSGAEEIPPLGVPRIPTLNFNSDNIYPTASTCAVQLTLPDWYYSNFENFEKALNTGFLFHSGFGLS